MTKRTLALITITAALILGMGSAPTLAHDDGYLALGDSVAFGFDPLVQDRSNPENFVGYPEALARMLDIDVANTSCPGEASGGFISLTGVDNSCQPYRANFPLHVNYNTSQLDFAVSFLRKHQQTELVTLNIGANDLFILQRQCTDDGTVDTECVLEGLPKVLNTLAKNLKIIYGRIRGEAGFHGQLVALTYYALDYTDATGVAVITAINSVVLQSTIAAGGKVASGFDAFLPAALQASGSSCAAGLLIVLSTNPVTCDIHPSPAGRDLLAGAIRAQVTVPSRTN